MVESTVTPFQLDAELAGRPTAILNQTQPPLGTAPFFHSCSISLCSFQPPRFCLKSILPEPRGCVMHSCKKVEVSRTCRHWRSNNRKYIHDLGLVLQTPPKKTHKWAHSLITHPLSCCLPGWNDPPKQTPNRLWTLPEVRWWHCYCHTASTQCPPSSGRIATYWLAPTRPNVELALGKEEEIQNFVTVERVSFSCLRRPVTSVSRSHQPSGKRGCKKKRPVGVEQIHWKNGFCRCQPSETCNLRPSRDRQGSGEATPGINSQWYITGMTLYATQMPEMMDKQTMPTQLWDDLANYSWNLMNMCILIYILVFPISLNI